MTILSNQRHERFAQELAAGKTATEAYELAGYKPNEGNAGRMNRNEQVRARVAELQGKASAKAKVTIESLISEAEEARMLAMQTKQPAAAVSALTAKGKLAGLWVEKRENTNKNVDPNSLSDADLARFILENGGADAGEDTSKSPVNPKVFN